LLKCWIEFNQFLLAHEGYLVKLKMDEDPLLIDEVRRLNNAFGIGIIKLDVQNIE